MSERMQQTSFDVSSYERPSKVWRCGHADQCASGPSPDGICSNAEFVCMPQRSVAANKRRFFILLMCTTVALVLLLLGSKSLLRTLSPGPLSMGHAEVASCQDCHTAADEPMSGWLHKAVRLNSNNDDQKCLSCHELGSNAFSPHSTAKVNLRSSKTDLGALLPVKNDDHKSMSRWPITLASKINATETSSGKDVSCSSCHREHQGKFKPLDEFNPEQCHGCHQIKFDEIETDHPEYSQFPHVQPTRINFDHVSHLENYFLDDENYDVAPQGCKQCHVTDQSGEWMLSNSFEATCSSCHLSDILGDSRADAKGLAVLAVPELDVDSLTRGGFNVGQWPKWADGEMTAIMMALVSTDSGVYKGSPLSTLYDLSSADHDDLERAARFAWQIKELFYDIQMGGAKVLNERIKRGFGNNLDQSTLNHLVASLPRDTLINNQQEWFPHLIQEVTDYRDGIIDIRAVYHEPASDIVESETSSNLITSDSPGQANSDDITPPFASEEPLLDDDILDDGSDLILDDDIVLNDDEDLLNDDIVLLEEDEAGEVINAGDVGVAADNEDWALGGGWYRDGSSIRYRPNDHADLFFKSWLDVSAKVSDGVNSALFSELSRKDSVGGCGKCHAIENDQSATQSSHQMHWQSFKPQDVAVDFNRFSHVSHFSLMSDDGCTSCHLLNANEVEQKTPLGRTYTSSFTNMDRQTCTQCHQKGRAPDNCLTCHNYHVEAFELSGNESTDSLVGGLSE